MSDSTVPSDAEGSPGRTGGRKRRLVAILAVAAGAVVAVGAAATAVTLTGNSHNAGPGGSSSGGSSLSGASRQLTAATPSYEVMANVTPPVSASRCTTATAFTYSGALTATEPGTVKYQWVYSSGKQGQVRVVRFAAAGRKTVAGDTVRTKNAGGGWAEIKMLSPVHEISDRATYKLLCGTSADGITAMASVTSPTATTCGTTPPALTVTGSITAAKAEMVTYYWAQSDGADSAPATLTFTGPGTQAVSPLTITPPGGSGTGSAVLVVTSPVTAASSPATYTLTCTPPAASPGTSPGLSATATVYPTSQTLTSCTDTPPIVDFSGTISDSKPGTVSYHWKLPSGNTPTYTEIFAAGGTTLTVVDGSYRPSSDNASGSGTLVITSPGSATSNTATFTLACGQGLAITNTAPTAAQAAEQYQGTMTVSGGKAPYTWTVTGLPADITASGSGSTLTIGGYPHVAGTYTATVSVHDSGTPRATGTTTLTLHVAYPPLSFSDGNIPDPTLGQYYSATVTGVGGNGTYTWGAVTGLAPGLHATASGKTLTISGTPTVTGYFVLKITISDTESPVQTSTGSNAYSVIAPQLRVTTTALPSGTAGAAYTATAAATGGEGTYTWKATGLPPGLSINASTGAITGTPTSSGTFGVTLTVSDSGSNQLTNSPTIPLTIA